MLLQLTTQVTYIHLQDIGTALKICAPNTVNQTIASGSLARGCVQFQVCKVQYLAHNIGWISATQEGLDPCQHLFKRKWFYQVVVGSCFQPRDAVRYGVTRGKHEHGYAISRVS